VKKTILLSLLAVACLAAEWVDLATVHRIRVEATERSKVGDHLFYLSDYFGPRVTNSSGFRKAAEWVVKRLGEYGLVNVHEEPWGPFGRAWENEFFSAHVVEPNYASLSGFALAYTASTPSAVTAEAVLAPLTTDADLEKFKGKLKGKVVLLDALRPPDQPPPTTRTLLRSGRYTDEDLQRIALAPEPVPERPPVDFARQREFRAKLAAFLRDEGVVAAITHGRMGNSGTIFGAGGGSHDPKTPLAPPMAVIAVEQYNRICRLLAKKVPVKIQLEIRNKVSEDSLDSFNVIGEIPGGQKRDEVVMLGAHLDSWQGGTGATDNAAGSAVVIEAVRILKALNLKMDRTVRVALWSAEEQGLLGSRAYVTAHFADRDTMQLKPEHAKLAAYFNLDNGSGKIRGIYLQNNDMLRPVFEEWLKPFRDMGAAAVTIRNTTGTDHLSFDAVGLPGFQFIQDPLDYNTKTHHSNMDVVDYVKIEDLMQASAVMASFVYHAATRPDPLPRKPLPEPRNQPRRQTQ